MLIQDIIREKPKTLITVAPDQSIADAAGILSENKIGALLVMDDSGKLAGILSERDIVRELGRSGSGCLDMNVSNLMTANVISCESKDPTEHALQMMTNGRFRHMPVVDDGKLVSIVTIGDVVQARLQQIKNENEALTDMIVGR